MAIELTADCTAYAALFTAAALIAGFWVVSRTVTTQPSPLTVTTQQRGFYLTTALGRTCHLTRARRLQYWKQALRYITRVIRIRKRWANTGRYLQQPRIRDLVAGISRKGGNLWRVSSAAIRRDDGRAYGGIVT